MCGPCRVSSWTASRNRRTGTRAIQDQGHEPPSIDTGDSASGIAQRYEILSALGHGGSSLVYKARDRSSEEIVAIKTFNIPDLDEKQVLAFQKEAEAVSVLRHDGIASVLDFGQTKSGKPYMVLEFLDGMALRELLRETPFLEGDVRVALLVDVCDALAYAHENDIVHGNLNSSNVMIVDEDGEKAAKVIDFGLAGIQGQTASDSRSDIRAAGTLINEVLFLASEYIKAPADDVRQRLQRLIERCLNNDESIDMDSVARELLEILHEVNPNYGQDRKQLQPGGSEPHKGTGPAAIIVPTIITTILLLALSFLVLPEHSKTRQIKDRKIVIEEPAATGDTSIDLSGTAFQAADLEKRLGAIGGRSVTSLNLSGCNLADSDLASVLALLSSMENVERLYLADNPQLSPTAMKDLVSIPGLQILDLSGTGADPALIESLAQLDKLGEVTVRNCPALPESDLQSLTERVPFKLVF
ncbi:MAG: serine/threonine protein kinase [Cyanobacteria bacterium HKST-UBA02]|nr:serine/threonine protein kinase [Cyanobacteria bacterium HKST-UBA02]